MSTFNNIVLDALLVDWFLNSIIFDFKAINLFTLLIEVVIFAGQTLIIAPLAYGDYGNIDFGSIFAILALLVGQGFEMMFGIVSNEIKMAIK